MVVYIWFKILELFDRSHDLSQVEKKIQSTHFGKRNLTPPNVHSRPTNSISYEN